MEECELTNVCRACLTEEGEFQSVFVSDENAGLTIHLAEMISACASVQVTLGDGLPEQICLGCASKTVSMYLFKLQCEESDTVLRERLKKSPAHIGGGNKNILEFLDDNCIKPSSVSECIIIKPELGEVELVESQINESTETVTEEFENLDGSDNQSDTSEDSEVALNDNDLENDFCEEGEPEEKLKGQNVKEFDCEICLKQFSRHDLLLRHKIAHAIKLEGSLEETFELEEEHGENTVVIKSEDVLYTCQEEDCDRMFIKKEELLNHMHLHHKKKSTSLVCKICSKKFSKQAHLNRHMKTHAAVKPHVCSTCNKSFARPEQLTNHLNVHSGIKPHTCDICFKGFNQISNLKDHIRTHNGERPFLCSTCGKGFNQLGNLRQHTIRHTGIKAHLCSTCGSGFASKGELSAHLRKHTGARPFVCPLCNHGFTTSSSLTKHKRIHSGEKPYECDVCKMKFSRSGILARHKRTHTGEKPYMCKYCTKAFSQSNDLTSHLRIHTGEKPYICDACGQAFRQSSALKTHKKTHVERNILEIERNINIYC